MKNNIKKICLTTIALFSILVLGNLTEVQASERDFTSLEIKENFKNCYELTTMDMVYMNLINNKIGVGRELTLKERSYLSRLDINQDVTVDAKDAAEMSRISAKIGAGKELSEKEEYYVKRLVSEEFDVEIENVEELLEDRELLNEVSLQLNNDYSTILIISSKLGVGSSRLDFNQDSTVDSRDASEMFGISSKIGVGKELNEKEMYYLKRLVSEEFCVEIETIEDLLEDKELLNKVGLQLNDDFITILRNSAKAGVGEVLEKQELTRKEMSYLSKLDVNKDGTINSMDIAKYHEYRKFITKCTVYDVEESFVKSLISSDFDNNDKIDYEDSTYLMNILVGNIEPEEGVDYDVNKDGETDILDVIRLNKDISTALRILEDSVSE